MGADSDVVISVASGNSAVPVVVLELGGEDTGGDDGEIAVVGDDLGAEEVVAWDEIGPTVRVMLLAFL